MHSWTGEEPLITSKVSLPLGMVLADGRVSVVGVYDADNSGNDVRPRDYGPWGETGARG